MNNHTKYNKLDFIRFVMSTIEHNSYDKEKSKDFLSSQELNVDAIVLDGLKRIKKIQMQIEAEKTKQEMFSMETVKHKATEWVTSLLSNTDFSLPALVKEEELSLCYKNLESLSQEDIKNILIKHFTLKFLEEQNKRINEF
jgi:hypothetical protein